ncbi:unnamed protein product, partial [Prorocentrum cordatum]
ALLGARPALLGGGVSGPAGPAGAGGPSPGASGLAWLGARLARGGAHWPEVVQLPPVWAALCALLLAFPAVTLWRLVRDPTSVREKLWTMPLPTPCDDPPPTKRNKRTSYTVPEDILNSILSGVQKRSQAGDDRLQREGWRQELLGAARRAAPVFSVFALMITLSVINKVLFRMVLVHVHTLSCSTNVAYLCNSWFAVLLKARWGSSEQREDLRKMVRFACRHWDLLASIGVCESAAFTMLPLVLPRFPKAIAPLMSQTLLPTSMLLNTVLLRRKYSKVQVGGVVVTTMGIYVASASESGHSAMSLGPGELAMPIFGSALAYFLLGMSFVFKDVAFVRSEREGCKLDLFFLEGLAAIGQCVALALQWPMNFVLLTGLPPRLYFQAAREAFFSVEGLMPGLLILYWAGNISYRLASLRAVRRLSSLASMLANLFSVPLSSLVFCLPLGLPLLGPPEPFSMRLVAGLLLICLGLVIYNWALLWGACGRLRA